MNRVYLLLFFVLIFPTPASATPAVEIQQTLKEIPKYDSIRVRVNHGVAHLEGNAGLNDDERKELNTLVQSFDGVRYVNNAVIDRRGFVERLTPALLKIRDTVTKFASNVPLYVLGVGILALFWFASGFVTRWVLRVISFANPKPLVENLVRQVVRIIVLVIGATVVLELLNITSLVGAVLGGAGIAGLAVGFALRDLVENHIAGLLLSMRRPFEKLDFIEVDQYQGKVIQLTTRETVLMTTEGNHLRIPNAIIFKSVLYNYTRNPNRRFDFIVGVGTEEDLQFVLSTGLKTLREMPGVLDDPKPFGLVTELGDSTVSIKFFAWVNQRDNDFQSTKSAGIRRVKEMFDQNGIQMPEPINRVFHHPFQLPEKKVRSDVEVIEDSFEVENQIDAQIKLAEGEQDLLDE